MLLPFFRAEIGQDCLSLFIEFEREDMTFSDKQLRDIVMNVLIAGKWRTWISGLVHLADTKSLFFTCYIIRA